MAKTHNYAVSLTWTGATQGPTAGYHTYSRDYEIRAEGRPALKGSADPAFLGNAAFYNPEDMVVAALSACHLLTYLAHCANNKVEIVAYEDQATGVMVQEGWGGRFTEVTLRPRVTISDSSVRAEAERLHDVAHKDCFVASSVNFPVRQEPEIIGGR